MNIVRIWQVLITLFLDVRARNKVTRRQNCRLLVAAATIAAVEYFSPLPTELPAFPVCKRSPTPETVF
jgi:hypothetical protein